LPVVISVES